MSEEATPTGDLFDELVARGDVIARDYLRRLEETSADGGRRTVRVRCKHCGQQNETTVEMLDAKEAREIVELVANLRLKVQQARAKDDTGSKKALSLRADISELTDAELAERIVRLEEELAS